MKRSTDHILTTHVGSLVKPDDLQTMINARERGEPCDAAALDARIKSAIGEVVRKQADVGVDIINDGEFSKSSWGAYFRERLTNVEARGGQNSRPGNIWDRDERFFPQWFEGARAGGGPRFSYVYRALQAVKGQPDMGSAAPSVQGR
jgi:5-methyltetrahydropteroyltriglutamate--homocysteine methyltransferase